MNVLSRHAHAVRKYVRSRLAPRTDRADDVVQDVFLAACENLDAYRGNSSLKSWLMGIARNKIRDYYRARLHEPQTLDPWNENCTAVIAPPKPDHLLDREFARQKTWQVLHQLPQKYRDVLLWRYWDDCSLKTIANRLGKTEKATERLLARAREEFRSAWRRPYRQPRHSRFHAAPPLSLLADSVQNSPPSQPFQ